jgi:GT2 family glycosyltransferase
VARATNLAIRLASHNSQYVALLDNDVIVRPDWLKKLIEVVQANPNIGSCQSLLLRTGAPGIIDGTGDFIDILGNALSRHSGERLEKLDLLRLDTDIFSARSAAMIVRRDLFEQLGGLDESFEMILEDVDLGWRIRIAGFSTRLVLDSVVLHAAGSTVKTLAKSFVMYQGTKNRVQMLLKNYEFLNLLRYVPMRVLLDLFGCLLLLMARKPELSYAIIRGLTWNLTHMPAVLRRRSVVQTRIRTVRDSRLIGKYIARKLFSRPTVVWHNLTRPHEERTVGTLTTEKGHISHYHDKTP